MQKTNTQLPGIQLVGITCRTNNEHVFKSDPATNKIAAIVQKYFHNGLFDKIQNRKKPGTTYCAYTEYESDFTGDYTFFIGEEVTSVGELVEGFVTLTIPTQDYAKFTNQPGPMPKVCIDMWKEIWTMNPADFGGERAYITDFEIYDERAMDHQNVVLDIYIGIK
jgi:predicted transcriptional regulator YdeE